LGAVTEISSNGRTNRPENIGPSGVQNIYKVTLSEFSIAQMDSVSVANVKVEEEEEEEAQSSGASTVGYEENFEDLNEDVRKLNERLVFEHMESTKR
jgi:hypothetical protein